MGTVALTETELNYLMSLVIELDQAGRREEAAAVARAFAALNEIAWSDLSDDDADLDPEFVRDMEEAEQDIVAGRLLPHGDVMHRLHALRDA